MARENVQNEYDAHLEDVQLLYTAYNRLGCTSGISTVQGNKHCSVFQCSTRIAQMSKLKITVLYCVRRDSAC